MFLEDSETEISYGLSQEKNNRKLHFFHYKQLV